MPTGEDESQDYVNAGGQTQLILVDNKRANAKSRYFSKAYMSAFGDLSFAKYGALLDALPWKQVKAFRGKVTRSSCWFTVAPCVCPYKYGRNVQPPWEAQPMPEWMIEIGNILSRAFERDTKLINSCNANRYDDDTQDLYWHKDNEDLFRRSDTQRDVFIISVSFGASRPFHIRANFDHDVVKVMLHDGCCMSMEGYFQDKYQHMLAAGSGICDNNASSGGSSSSSLPDPNKVRFNLTYRFVHRHLKSCPMRN